VTNEEVEDLKGHFDKVAQELRAQVTGLRGEMTAGFADVRGEMTVGFADVRGEMTVGFADLRRELSEFRLDSAAVADHLMEEITSARREAGVVADDLRSRLRTVAEGVALANERIDDVDLRADALAGRVDGLTLEVRRGFAGMRAEVRRLRDTDDELRRRIESQEHGGA
jgi:hypothetical protein